MIKFIRRHALSLFVLSLLNTVWIILQPSNNQNENLHLRMGTSRINKRTQGASHLTVQVLGGEDLVAAQIPICAEHTFLALYEKHQQRQLRGGADEETEDKYNKKSSCKGMLLRDDIILTTHECSQSPNLFFESSHRGPEGLLEATATPHTALNANMGLHSKLGFLQVKDVPFHYIFADQPVRRTRMFISLRSHPDTDVAEEDDDYNITKGSSGSTRTISSMSPYITCRGYRPIVHNFPLPNGEMVPVGEELLTVGLPDDLLWEHADLDTAPELNDDKERWWTKAITLEEGEESFQKYFDAPSIKGPEGSLSIVRAHMSFIGKASGICEAFDPRGHRGEACFDNYVARWWDEEPFSGTNFFDWVDYGTGKSFFERNKKDNFLPDSNSNDNMVGRFPDDECTKEKLDSRTVHFFNETERKEHEIYLSHSKGGQQVIARYKQSGAVVGPSFKDYPHLYVFDLNKQMYMVERNLWDSVKYGKIKHTSLVHGKPVLSAGEAYLNENGVVEGINFSSGHYKPKIAAATIMYQWMKDQGLSTTAFNWMPRSRWSKKDCYETNWKGFEIRAFDSRVLEKTCREVTTSPIWII